MFSKFIESNQRKEQRNDNYTTIHRMKAPGWLIVRLPTASFFFTLFHSDVLILMTFLSIGNFNHALRICKWMSRLDSLLYFCFWYQRYQFERCFESYMMNYLSYQYCYCRVEDCKEDSGNYEQLTHNLVDPLLHNFVDRMIHNFVDRMIHNFADRLSRSFVDWLIHNFVVDSKWDENLNTLLVDKMSQYLDL